MCKRLSDIFISIVMLVLFIPVYALVALCIRFESPGSVIFTQERVGKKGKPFNMFKFRSMIIGAEKEGPHFTSPTDTRVTKMGKLIRKTSLDELPQLLNVVLGQMSLVGPRPNMFVQREEYTEVEWNSRNSVKPGITGLAQATLRSNATRQQRLDLDLEYTAKATIYFDMWILLLTLKQVFSKGSH
jgi:lipopolysaccharide/colanic/teichoic acid biosynthesis glycosyltransferase